MATDKPTSPKDQKFTFHVTGLDKSGQRFGFNVTHPDPKKGDEITGTDIKTGKQVTIIIDGRNTPTEKPGTTG